MEPEVAPVMQPRNFDKICGAIERRAEELQQHTGKVEEREEKPLLVPKVGR